MTSFDASRAQPPVEFPLSGPPVCVALLGNKMLRELQIRPVHDERKGATFIKIGDAVHSKNHTDMFYLEPSLEHDGLLHVRCGHNNKYWVAQQMDDGGGGSSSDEWFICSAADEPEEDLHKPTCTLFDFRQYLPDQFRFFHAQQHKYASIFSDSKPSYMKLRDVPDADDRSYNSVDYTLNTFRVSRLSLQKELPRYVCFKGANGRYLKLKDEYLQFSASDVTDPGVVHESFTDEFGVVTIKPKNSGKLWRLTPGGWICANYSGPMFDTDQVGYVFSGIKSDKLDKTMYHDVNILFKVVFKEDNYISLQNISNGRFCKRLTDGDKMECLSACLDDGETDIEAILQFEEPVRSREIYDVHYRAGGKKTRMLNEDVTRTEVHVRNKTNQTHSAEHCFQKYYRTESTWNVDLKLDAGIKTHLTASVPLWIFDVEGGIEGNLDLEAEYKWGATDIRESKNKATEIFSVGPKKEVTCSVFSTQAIVDVPFSYKQKDTLYSGETLPPRQMHDGIYGGVRSSDTHIETK